MDKIINTKCPKNAGLPEDPCADCAEFDHNRGDCGQQHCWHSCTVCQYNHRDYFCNPCGHCDTAELEDCVGCVHYNAEQPGVGAQLNGGQTDEI